MVDQAARGSRTLEESGRVASDDLHTALETGGTAKNYYTWLTDAFVPHLRGRVIEHGAGSGSLSDALVRAGVSPIVLTEPNDRLMATLRQRFADRSDVEVFHGTLDEYLASAGPGSVDAIVSSNVLEHIRDDEACLATMRKLLRPGGRLVLYVPARPELYGEFDRLIGHYRRYRRRELRDKLLCAGFTIETLNYRNLLTTLAWLWNVRILGKKSIENGNLDFFDRYIFPVIRAIEDVVPPLYGLNLLAVASVDG
ncbi:MAG TPA: methyltransferase [Polyangiaceae bacterium]|nr:methyltransferase [Polyangiaceae bacterium]